MMMLMRLITLFFYQLVRYIDHISGPHSYQQIPFFYIVINIFFNAFKVRDIDGSSSLFGYKVRKVP